MHDVFVEDFESEPFMTAFKTYFGEISGRERNWPLLFRRMNAEKDVTKAIMRLDGDTVVGFILFCPLQLSCPIFTESYGYIRELWVAPEYRRTGSGGQLLTLAEQYFFDLQKDYSPQRDRGCEAAYQPQQATQVLRGCYGNQDGIYQEERSLLGQCSRERRTFSHRGDT